MSGCGQDVYYLFLVALAVGRCSAMGAYREDSLELSAATEQDVEAVGKNATCAKDQPKFRVMNWNILADGLATDGFVVPLIDDDITYRLANDWDKIVGANNESELYKLLTSKPCRAKDEDETMKVTLAEFIADQKNFKKFVVDPFGKALKASLALIKVKYDEKKHFKTIATCAQIFMAHMHVYPGHAEFIKHSKAGVSAAFGSLEPAPETVEALLKEPKTKCSGMYTKNVATQENADLDTKIKAFMLKYFNALEHLNRKWGLPMHIESLRKSVEWGSSARQEEAKYFKADLQGRGSKIVALIAKMEPDILGLEEVDHYRFMVDQLGKHGYTSEIGRDKPYSFESANAHCPKGTDDSLERFAFHPKCGSASKTYNEAWGASNSDNDGSALFWKSGRFKALKIKKWTHENEQVGSDGGVVCVLLRDLFQEQAGERRYVWAMATHLNSGEGIKQEEQRIAKIAALQNFFVEELLNDDVIVSCREDTKLNCKLGMVLAMDGNSAESGNSKGLLDDAMYLHVKSDLKLANYAIEQADDATYRTVTVNKMRGAATAQPWKLGEYQLEAIDYVAFNDALIQDGYAQTLKGGEHGTLKRLSRYNTKEQTNAHNEILPNVDNPSDHVPVIVTLCWGEMK